MLQVSVLLAWTIWSAFSQMQLTQDGPTLTVFPDNLRQHNMGGICLMMQVFFQVWFR